MLRPEVIEPLPEDFPTEFSLYSETDSHDVAWWKTFNSSELNLLMAVSLAENFTVLEAQARLEQARYAAQQEQLTRHLTAEPVPAGNY